MTKALLALLASTVVLVARAELVIPDVVFPTLPAQGRTAAAFVPAGWTIEKQVQADLDRDGLPDFVLVLQMQDPANIVANPDGLGVDPLDSNPRLLVVGLQDRQQAYRLAIADHALIPRHVMPTLEDPFADARSSNGGFKIALSYFANAGSWSTFRVEYTFRFEDDCFRLIGYDRNETRRNTGETSALSLNYLSGKAKVSTGSMEDDEQHHEWRPLQGKRKVCLQEIGNGLDFNPESSPAK